MSASSRESAVIDMVRMREAADGDEDFLRQLVEVFLEDAQLKLAQIQAAIAANDARGLGRMAHQLKGSSANVGADRLRDLAKSLEVIARAENVNGAQELAHRLEGELHHVRVELQPLLLAS